MQKKYDPLLNESLMQKQWEQEKTYAMENNPGELFSIDTPPPTVSGTLHIGHIFSYTQTDIAARYKRMNGFSVFYPFGFDDNGLATERYVEKKRDIRGHEMPRSEFIAICIEESLQAAQNFKQLWQKMGLSIDWSLIYSTISHEARRISQASFIELFKKNYIYRKQEPALYCTTCRTSVAQAELDDQEMPSFFNDIIFKDNDGNDLIIATTRPELLPACAAVLYHPSDTRYTHLKYKKATVPLFNYTVPFLEDDLVNPEKGTGLVMVCTFGDKTDIIWYKKHNLPYRQVIGLDGKCTSNAGFLEGLKVADARKVIIEKLREHNLLSNQKIISHTVGIHERCKKEIEFTILPQWFISILPYKQHFLEMGNAINWHPTFMKTRYDDWVNNLAWDWGISRQRFYGIPFPAWHCSNCSAIIIAELDQLPIDPQETPYQGICHSCGSSNIKPDTDVMDTWNTSSLTPYICCDLLTHKTLRYSPTGHSGRAKKNTNPELEEESYSLSARLTPCFDSLHMGTPAKSNEAGDKKRIEGCVCVSRFLPMSLRPQAHDIIRTWAFDTIVKSWMHQQTIPWKDIVISGHVLSDKKEKISKKDGTAMDPLNLLQKYPADAIRYWTASSKLGQDTMFSEEQLMIGQKVITKLWNAFKFAEPHITNMHFEKTPKEFSPVNQWILHKISQCFVGYCSYFEQYECGLALNILEQFFWNDFCDNYIELIKNQLFNPNQYNPQEVYSTQWTLYNVGLRLLQMYAPYMPHIVETTYQELYKPHMNTLSIHQTRYADIQIAYIFEKETQEIDYVIAIATQIRKLKTEHQLSLKTALETLHIFAKNDKLIQALKQHDQLISGVTQAAKIIYKLNEDSRMALEEKDGLWYAYISLA